jgi:hypothetical protein
MCVGRRRRPCRFVCRTRATRVIQRGMRRSRSLPPRGSCRTKRRAFVADFRTDQPRAARAGPATSQRQLEPLSPLLKGFEKTVFIIRGACRHARQHRAPAPPPLQGHSPLYRQLPREGRDTVRPSEHASSPTANTHLPWCAASRTSNGRLSIRRPQPRSTAKQGALRRPETQCAWSTMSVPSGRTSCSTRGSPGGCACLSR